MAKSRTPPWARMNDDDKQFIPVYYGMLRSQAWRELSQNARAIYLAMRMRYGPANGYSDRIRISYSSITRDAKVRRGSIRSALEELEQAGFIRIESQAMKTVNEYRFMSDWKKVKENR